MSSDCEFIYISLKNERYTRHPRLVVGTHQESPRVLDEIQKGLIDY